MEKAGRNIFSMRKTISAVLIIYLLLRSSQFAYALINASEFTLLIIVRSIVLISSLVFSYLTLKCNIFACRAMAIFLLLSGVSIFLFGIFVVSTAQYLLKILSIILGIYFSYGAIILFKFVKKEVVKEEQNI